MTAFNPYLVDEVLFEATPFGLIPEEEGAAAEELHGYEITLSGRIVVPRLRIESEEAGGENSCEAH